MAMYRFLNVLARCSYDFEEAAREAASSIESLDSLDDWNPYGHEVIPYAIWIKAKLAQIPPFDLMIQQLLSGKDA
jgi:hypothetical protein